MEQQQGSSAQVQRSHIYQILQRAGWPECFTFKYILYTKYIKHYNTERIFTNIQVLLCSVVDPGDHVCHSYSYGLRAIIQCLPAWFRFIQCLRRYRDSKRAFPHLVNAGKYSTTFFVVTFAALYATHRGRRGKPAATEAQRPTVSLEIKQTRCCSCRSAACVWRVLFVCSGIGLTLNSNGSLDFLAASTSCFVQHNPGQTCFCSYSASLKEESWRNKSSRKEMKESLPLEVKSFSAWQPPN